MIKYLHLIFVVLIILYPSAIRADYSLEQLRIANVLANEVGNLGKIHMQVVAEVIRNRYNEQHKKGNSNITYSDILFHSYSTTGDSDFSGARSKFADKDKNRLMEMGRKKMGSDAGWNMALDFAGQLLKGTLNSNISKGANSFHGCSKKYTTAEAANTCMTKKEGKVLYLDVIENAPRNHAYHWMELGSFKHKYASDTVASPSTFYGPSASQGATQGESSDGSVDASVCAMEEMQRMYLTEGKVDEYCWYCKIVIVLVNAYLKVANDALGQATLPLGKIILKLGFLIWLAYYILQQVSSLKAITPSKMLQEILVMGFKVAFAYAVLQTGTNFIRDYYVNPIVETGVDYGSAIFRQMNIQ